MHDTAIAQAAENRGYERALDEFGILHGEDARKFMEELKHPSPLTPEAAELVKRAREIAAKGREQCRNHKRHMATSGNPK